MPPSGGVTVTRTLPPGGGVTVTSLCRLAASRFAAQCVVRRRSNGEDSYKAPLVDPDELVAGAGEYTVKGARTRVTVRVRVE